MITLIYIEIWGNFFLETKKGYPMLGLSTFSDQFPDPSKDEVLRMLEEVKLELISEFSLETKPNVSALIPATTQSSFETLSVYMQEFEFVHTMGIATIQTLMPPQFSDLIRFELEKWIPSPTIANPP